MERERTLEWGLGGVTLGTRGFSRVRREFSVWAEGRHIFGRRPKPREKLFARVTIKTWQKPETALEKSLAPRVRWGNPPLLIWSCLHDRSVGWPHGRLNMDRQVTLPKRVTYLAGVPHLHVKRSSSWCIHTQTFPGGLNFLPVMIFAATKQNSLKQLKTTWWKIVKSFFCYVLEKCILVLVSAGLGSRRSRVQTPAGPTLRILKQLRGKCCLCNDICKR